jgi:hypothetical protein
MDDALQQLMTDEVMPDASPERDGRGTSDHEQAGGARPSREQSSKGAKKQQPPDWVKQEEGGRGGVEDPHSMEHEDSRRRHDFDEVARWVTLRQRQYCFCAWYCASDFIVCWIAQGAALFVVRSCC